MTLEELYNIKKCTDFYKSKTKEMGNIINNYKQKNESTQLSKEEKEELLLNFNKNYREKVNELLDHLNTAIPKLQSININRKEKMVTNILNIYIITKKKLEDYMNNDK